MVYCVLSLEYYLMEVIILVERKEYLERLIKWEDEQVIKVVTGIRRCGKSTLLLQYQAWLQANGISDDQIVSSMFLPVSVIFMIGISFRPFCI